MNDLNKTENLGASKTAKKPHKSKIGGQALIEGVMMRGVEKEAMAVRQKDGEIHIEVKTLPKNKWYQKAPFVRGVFNFVLQMKNGYDYLMKSMEISGMLDEEEEDKNKKAINAEIKKAEDKLKEEIIANAEDKEEALKEIEAVIAEAKAVTETAALPENEAVNAENKAEDETEPKDEKKSEAADKLIGVIGMLLGVGLAIFLFMFVPAQGFSLFSKLPAFEGADINKFQALFEGVIRIGLFVAYMWAVSLMKEIRVTYEYHGAEHKTIAAHEAGAELIPEVVKDYTRFHPRCGTSFMFLVLAISIIFFSVLQFFLPISGAQLAEILNVPIIVANIARTGVKLLCLPFLVGITYEVIKLAGRYDRNIVMRIISAPGLWLQRLTTREPTLKQLEVAIAAILPVIPENRELDNLDNSD